MATSGLITSLEGQAALVTGGGRGIGRAVAGALADAGVQVAVAARTRAEIDQTARELSTAARAIQLDVSDEDSCRVAVEEVAQHFGRLDIVVNAAGIASSQKFTKLSTATWREMLAVDLDGPMFVIRAALPQMLTQGYGRVISIGSTASLVGGRYVAAYTAAKHGLLGLTRALATEYAKSGVTFNCVCPSFVDTEMTAQTISNIIERTGCSPEEAEAALHSPQGRLITADEVAAICVLLAGEAGRSINGQAITIDGGLIAS